MQETISIFNPYGDDAPNIFNYAYQVLFHFSDGTSLFWNDVSFLNPWARVDIRPQDAQAVPMQTGTVWDKIQSNPSFRFYSVEVISAPLASAAPFPVGGVVATRTRVQNTWGQNITSSAGLDSRTPVLYLTNPEFGTA
jgi:hypothetical protein